MYLKITELDLRENFTDELGFLGVYGKDVQNALWNNCLFSNKSLGRFLKGVSKKTIEELPGDNAYRNGLLSIDKHPAILPYKHVLSIGGLDIRTQEVSLYTYFYAGQFSTM